MPISIHAPRTGSDSGCSCSFFSSLLFQSTLPARGATQRRTLILEHADFNPRSPHGERRVQAKTVFTDSRHFNPRSPHGERPQADFDEKYHIQPVISIHAPRTGSDVQHRDYMMHPRHFNPRSPHGERPELFFHRKAHSGISIHAPRTGSDTYDGKPIPAYIEISIHAPRTGSDSVSVRQAIAFRNFNPRSPHGERLIPLGFHPRLD